MSQLQIIGYDLPDFFTELKKSLIPEITEKLSAQFQPKEPNEFLTRKEVCDLLKINLSTLYRWCKDGTLSSFGIGNRVYFLRSHIEEVLIKNKLS